MLQPVLDPVLSRDILARYTTFASAVGAPAPMEHLAPASGTAPARYETYVENLYEITHLLRKNTVLNLQWDLRFVALHLADAIQQADVTRTRRLQMLERQVTLLQDETGRLQAALRRPQPSGNTASQGTRPEPRTVLAARQAALAPLPAAEPAPPTPAPRVLAQPNPVRSPEGDASPAPAPRHPTPEQAAESLPARPRQTGQTDGARNDPGSPAPATQSRAVGPEPAETTHPAPKASQPAPAAHPRSAGPAPEKTASPAPMTPRPAPAVSARPDSPVAPPARSLLQTAQSGRKAAVERQENGPAPQTVTPGTPPAPTPVDRVLARPAAAEQAEKTSSPTTGHHPGPAPGQTTGKPPARPQAIGHVVPTAPQPAQGTAVFGMPDRVLPGTLPTAVSTAPMAQPLHPAQEIREAGQRRAGPPIPSATAARQPPRPARVPLGHIEPAEGEAEPAPLSDPRPGRLQRPTPSPRVLRQDPPERASQRQSIQPTPAAAPESAGVVPASGPAASAARPAGTATRPGAASAEASLLRQERPAPANVQPPVNVRSSAQPGKPAPALTQEGQAAPVTRRNPETAPPVARVHAEPAVSAVPAEEAAAAPAIRSSQGAAPQPLPPAVPAPRVHPAAPASSAAVSKAAPVPASPAGRSTASPATGPRQNPSAVPPAVPASGLRSAAAEPMAAAVRAASPRPSGQAAAPATGPAASPAVLPPLPPAAPAPLVYGTSPATSDEPAPRPAAASARQPASPGMTVPAAAAAAVPRQNLPGTAARTGQTAAFPPASRTAQPFRTLSAAAPVPKIAAFAPASYRTALSGNTARPGSTFLGRAVEAPRHSEGSAALTWAVPASTAGTVETPAAQNSAQSSATRNRPAPPAGSPAPMELRHAPAPAAAEPAPASPWTSADIQTVRRTRTTHRETHQEAPSTVTVQMPNQPAARPAPAPLGPAEVERLAEKVYRQIEERLRSEKMRRGM